MSAADVHRTPPHSVDAEQGVIGSIFKSGGKVIPECVEKIRPEFFYVPPLRTIYEQLLDTWDAGTAIDLISFTQRLRDKKSGTTSILESVGGAAFVTHLAVDFVPSAANVAYYLDIVRDKYILRQRIVAGTELVRSSYEEQDEPLLGLDEIQSKLASIQSLHGRNGTLFQDAAEALSKPIITPPDVIEGIVHEGGKLVLGGASKAYKTWLLCDLAVSKATGSMWLNFTTKKGRVLYINCELPDPFFWKRIRAICDERQLTIEAGMLVAVHLRGRIRDWEKVRHQIRQGQFSLIILDPIYKLLFARGFVRNEIDPGPIADLLEEIEALAVRVSAAVAFGAHYSKGDQSQKEAIDRISGHGIWTRDADSIINFTKHENFVKGENECFSAELELRTYPPQKSFVVRWDQPLFITDSTLDPTRLKQRKPAGAAEKQFTIQDDLIPLLRAPLTPADLKKAACNRMSPATFYRLQKEAWADEAIIETTDGKIEVNPEWKPSD